MEFFFTRWIYLVSNLHKYDLQLQLKPAYKNLDFCKLA